MNYRSQQKSWAVDRALQIHKQNSDFEQGPMDVKKILETAQELADFCYVTHDHDGDISARLKEIREDLEYLESMNMKPASNALDKEQGNA